MGFLTDKVLRWWENGVSLDPVVDWTMHLLFGEDRKSDGSSPRVVTPDAEDIYKEDIAPYLPGAQQTQAISDSVRYWNDYEKNTGKKRRYPGLQTHSPDIGDVVSGFNWWVDE